MSAQPLPGLEPAVALTDRQAFALTVVRERGPIASEELGASLHAWRQERGGRGHAADGRCRFCASEGASVGRMLAAKGLVKRVRSRGWVPADWKAPAPSSRQMGPDDDDWGGFGE